MNKILIIFIVFFSIVLLLIGGALLTFYFKKQNETAKEITLEEYTQKKEKLIADFKEISESNSQIVSERKDEKSSINDPGENLFGRDKTKLENVKKINIKHFNNIIDLDEREMTVDVEANIKFPQLIEYLHKYGYQPVFTVDMYHISVGGLICGVGGGSACAKNGAFHDSIIEMDVLTSDGDIKTCTKDENKNLFFSMPNSYGSLGYIIRVKMLIEKIKPYVKVNNLYFNNSKEYFDKIDELQKQENKCTYDFLEGTIFNDKLFVIMVGNYVDDFEGSLLDPVGHRVYWKELRDRRPDVHYFKTNDYNWRWDVDGYYTTIDMGWFFTNEILRPFVPRFLMNGNFLRPFAESYLGVDYKDGNMVHDILFPTKNAAEIFDWYDKEVGLYPMYICPICKTDESYFFNIPGNYVDFGIGYGPTAKTTEQSLIWKKKLEKKMLEEEGVKLLYCKQWMSEKDFWKTYENKDSFFKKNPDIKKEELKDKTLYDYIKEQYDKSGKFPSLYKKVS